MESAQDFITNSFIPSYFLHKNIHGWMQSLMAYPFWRVCRWKLYRVWILYTFIKLNQEQLRKMQLRVPGRNQTLALPVQRSNPLSSRVQLSSSDHKFMYIHILGYCHVRVWVTIIQSSEMPSKSWYLFWQAGIPKVPLNVDEQFFLDNFYLLVCRAKNWQLFQGALFQS
jgi:hypothetical protein